MMISKVQAMGKRERERASLTWAVAPCVHCATNQPRPRPDQHERTWRSRPDQDCRCQRTTNNQQHQWSSNISFSEAIKKHTNRKHGAGCRTSDTRKQLLSFLLLLCHYSLVKSPLVWMKTPRSETETRPSRSTSESQTGPRLWRPRPSSGTTTLVHDVIRMELHLISPFARETPVKMTECLLSL